MYSKWLVNVRSHTLVATSSNDGIIKEALIDITGLFTGLLHECTSELDSRTIITEKGWGKQLIPTDYDVKARTIYVHAGTIVSIPIALFILYT